MSVISKLLLSSGCRSVCVLLLTLMLVSCDRGAGVQIKAAKQFARSVALHDTLARDSMIATARFHQHFSNDFVEAELIELMRTIYDPANDEFKGKVRADVDADLRPDLQGGLRLPGEIEETGMVRVKSPMVTHPYIYFWMVKQQDRKWQVAMVTKGEQKVLFK